MKLTRRNLLVGLLVIAGLAQLIQPARSNPPVTAELAAPAEVMSILRRSCYDCHSNETVWPWYSRIAPLSWLVAHDVAEGREHLNFSDWGAYRAERRAKLLREIREEVGEGEMPPLLYLPAHPDARLDDRARGVVLAWADSGARRD